MLPNKAYDILKWLGLACLPAIAWFIGQVGADIGIADNNVWEPSVFGWREEN